MKTVILYASKHGAAGEVARRIAQQLDNACIHDLKQSKLPSLADFDCIIFGSSLYAGMIRKEAKAFLSHNADILLQKKLGLFLSGIGAEGEKTYFESNFSPDLLQKAKAASFLGGIFDPRKAGVLERLVIKLVTKKSAYVNIIDDAKIEQFAKVMKT